METQEKAAGYMGGTVYIVEITHGSYDTVDSIPFDTQDAAIEAFTTYVEWSRKAKLFYGKNFSPREIWLFFSMYKRRKGGCEFTSTKTIFHEAID